MTSVNPSFEFQSKDKVHHIVPGSAFLWRKIVWETNMKKGPKTEDNRGVRLGLTPERSN